MDYDSRQPVTAQTVNLRFRLNDRPEIAASTLELTLDPDAHWRGSSSAVSLDGRWTVTATVQTGSDAVEVPMELVAGRRPSSSS